HSPRASPLLYGRRPYNRSTPFPDGRKFLAKLGRPARPPAPPLADIRNFASMNGVLQGSPRQQSVRSPQVEMRLDKLALDGLPKGERKFLELIAGGMYPAYGAGFEAELATLQ